MNRNDRLSFFREISELLEQISDVFDSYDIPSHSTDCESEDCDLPNDEDILNIRQLLQDIHQIIESNN